MKRVTKKKGNHFNADDDCAVVFNNNNNITKCSQLTIGVGKKGHKKIRRLTQMFQKEIGCKFFFFFLINKFFFVTSKLHPLLHTVREREKIIDIYIKKKTSVTQTTHNNTRALRQFDTKFNRLEIRRTRKELGVSCRTVCSVKIIKKDNTKCWFFVCLFLSTGVQFSLLW